MTTMKLSDYVADFVARKGVRHVFMLPGGGCMHLVDSFGKHPGLEYVANLHEQALAVAVDAYGQATNRLGVGLVTTGPGGTNTLTGVAAAWLDSTPCLFVSGQVKRADLKGDRGVRQLGFQEIDIVRMVSPITKYAVTVLEPETIRFHLEKAAHLATTGRPGPVWVDVPLDVQAAPVDPDALQGFSPPQAEPNPRLAEQVARTLELLRNAERPALLVGNGVRLAGAERAFVELAGRLSAPVLLTWKAADFLADDHPLYAGRPGAVASRGANFTQQNSDFLLCLGARLDHGQTGYWPRNLARAAKKVVVDVDGAELRKLDLEMEVAVEADAGDFLAELSRQLGGETIPPRPEWISRVKAWAAKYPVVLPEYFEQKGTVNNYVLVERLSERLREGDLVVPGSSGACSELTMQALKIRRGVRLLNSEGLGPMGFGIAAALGACLASGRRRTLTLDGDGGFHMNAQELEVVRRLGLPIKFFVLNNDGYGSIRTTQRNYFQGRYVASEPSSGLTLPDTCRVAEAYGIPAAKVRDHDELDRALDRILDGAGPFVCEVMISPDQTTMPRLSSGQRPDGSMFSKPLEDLFPFLPRDEFRAEMIVPPLPE